MSRRFLIVLMLIGCLLSAGELTITKTFSKDALTITKAGEWDIVELKGYPAGTRPGDPRLPDVRDAVLIPSGSLPVSVEIVSEEVIELEGEYNIIPTHKDVPLPVHNRKIEIKPQEPNKEVYQRNQNYPYEKIKLLGSGNKNGYRIAQVRIYPVLFNPVTKKLYLTTKITYRIKYEEGKTENFIPTEKQKKVFGEDVKSIVVNPQDVEKFAPVVRRKPSLLDPGNYEYVVISEPPLDTCFQRLVYWKTKKGVPAKIVTKSWINANYPGTDIQMKIRNFIIDAHNTWGTTYILLGGSADDVHAGQNIIPSRDAWYTEVDGNNYDTIPCDLYYADLDGTWNADGDNVYGEQTDNVDMYADVYVGRAPVYTIAQAQNFVNKVLAYEKSPEVSKIKKMFLPSAILWDAYENSDAMQDSIADMTPAGWADTILSERDGNLDHDRSIGLLNQGYGYSHSMGHGDWNGVYTYNDGPIVHSQDIDTLTNGYMGVYNSIACLPGAWDMADADGNYDCAAEHFINRTMNGATAVMFNTRYGFGAYVNGDYVPGPSERIDTTFWHKFLIGNQYIIGQPFHGAKDQWVPYADSGNEYDMTRWCIYEHTLFGDPELPMWKDYKTLTVNHPGTHPVGGSGFPVTVTDLTKAPVEGARVTLWCKLDPTKYVTGYTNASGEVTLTPNATMAGDTMWVTVTKQDYDPSETYAIIVPGMKVFIEPDTINVNTPTPITVTVYDSSGTIPQPDIEVKISRYDVYYCDTTNASGVASFSGVNSPYGQLLFVYGRKLTEQWNSFIDTIWVINASNFTTADIQGNAPLINVTGYLMKNIPGVVTSTTTPSGHKIFLSGCGIDTNVTTSGGSVDIDVLPTSNGNILGTIVKNGYNIYQENITVKDFKGYVSGIVRNVNTNESIPNARVRFYPQGSDTTSTPPSLNLLTGSDGRFSGAESLLCGYYDVYASAFGYYSIDTVEIVQNPTNDYTLYLSPTPSCAFTGYVLENTTNKPLSSVVKIYRHDNGELYQTVTTDSLTGGVFTINLPYWTYDFKVSSYHHIPAQATFDLNTSTYQDTFYLDVTVGNILVIDDENDQYKVRKSFEELKKMDRYEPLWYPNLDTSATKVFDWLTELGYAVDTTSSANAISKDWSSYDVVIVCCGDDHDPLTTTGITDKITNWVNTGGRLIVEGGEVGYDWKGTTFGTNVLHLGGTWNTDNAGALTLQNSTHPVATTPNTLPSSIPITYSDYGDEDACTIASDATLIYGTTSYPTSSGIHCYDDTPAPERGQSVFLLFNVSQIDTTTGKQLIENAVHWLLATESGPDAVIYGHVETMGNPNDAGAIVKVWNTGKYVAYDTTDASGNYSIPVYAGTYSVYATREGYNDTTVTGITVSSGGSAQVNVNLYPLVTIYFNDFETNNGGFTGDGCWQWGDPQYSGSNGGPSDAHSGIYCWGTNLTGDYPASTNSRLTTPAISIPSGQNVKLEFYQWLRTEFRYDGGNVKVSTNGSTFSIINPVSPEKYDTIMSSLNVGIPNEWGFSSNGGRNSWKPVTFNLSSYGGQNVYIRWHFGSDGSIQYPGWYIDDVRIYYVDYTVGITELPKEFGVELLTLSGKDINVSLSLPVSSEVDINVLDIAGRVIERRNMIKGAGVWNETIKMTKSGVYFVKVRLGEKRFIKKVIVF